MAGLALLKEGGNTVFYDYRVSQAAPGLYCSVDGGKTWRPLGTGTKGTMLYLATAPNNHQIFYAVDDNNAVFQSQDGVKSWKELG